MRTRSGHSYFKEVEHLRQIREFLNTDYALDRKILRLLRERRRELLDELEPKSELKLINSN
jgi:hypothetical protein